MDPLPPGIGTDFLCKQFSTKFTHIDPDGLVSVIELVQDMKQAYAGENGDVFKVIISVLYEHCTTSSSDVDKTAKFLKLLMGTQHRVLADRLVSIFKEFKAYRYITDSHDENSSNTSEDYSKKMKKDVAHKFYNYTAPAISAFVAANGKPQRVFTTATDPVPSTGHNRPSYNTTDTQNLSSQPIIHRNKEQLLHEEPKKKDVAVQYNQEPPSKSVSKHKVRIAGSVFTQTKPQLASADNPTTGWCGNKYTSTNSSSRENMANTAAKSGPTTLNLRNFPYTQQLIINPLTKDTVMKAKDRSTPISKTFSYPLLYVQRPVNAFHRPPHIRAGNSVLYKVAFPIPNRQMQASTLKCANLRPLIITSENNSIPTSMVSNAPPSTYAKNGGFQIEPLDLSLKTSNVHPIGGEIIKENKRHQSEEGHMFLDRLDSETNLNTSDASELVPGVNKKDIQKGKLNLLSSQESVNSETSTISGDTSKSECYPNSQSGSDSGQLKPPTMVGERRKRKKHKYFKGKRRKPNKKLKLALSDQK